MVSLQEIEQTQDDDVLESMAAATEDIGIKIAIRRKQKGIREKRLADFEAAKAERYRQEEDATTMRIRMAELDKQRKMREFEEQSRIAKMEMGASEEALRLRQRLADEEKQRKLDAYKKNALVMTASYNSGVSEYLDEKLGKKTGSNASTEPKPYLRQLSGFGGMSYAANPATGSVENQPSRTNAVNASWNTDGVKQVLLNWCQAQVSGYQNVNITNFSSSWSDGLAFCALIHHFHPDAFDFSKLTPKNRRGNFSLAFSTAEKVAGIYPMLDVEDMVRMKNPDWKSVFTYVQAFHQRFSKGAKNAAGEE